MEHRRPGGGQTHRLSERLIKQLRAQWAPGGLLHYGQGKWYPGESLPRWALGCYWRQDGRPVWEDDRWIADVDRDYGFGTTEAKVFIETLADTLGVRRDFIRPAYEDILYYLHKEQRLPVNVDPLDPRLTDPEARARMVETFRQGLGAVTGYVLPLQHGSWKSGPWLFRGSTCTCCPATPPQACACPWNRCPGSRKRIFPTITPWTPWPSEAPCRTCTPGKTALAGAPSPETGEGVRTQPRPYEAPEPVPGESAAWVVRTALCVQPREGRLYVFMPPVATLEGYLELTAAIEATARQTGCPVVIEGYTPPYDPRMNSLKITPDPGVIEVNIQPMHNWREMVAVTTTLYETARQTRLGTEKFMLDGRHTGTGGGNHIVVGRGHTGRQPLSAPAGPPTQHRHLLEQPPVSLLSVLGLFIGPTSQQPRIDEARHDSLYELEIAFAEMERQTGPDRPCPPWLVDRLFRNLLVDVTGNTHRAEFCIDKLYSPDSAAGRLGLLEFRGFEMPPHARMSLAQQLLLRICIAWFWRIPYRQDLIRWGTRLHDCFMLPQPVQDDFDDVLATLHEAGYPVSMAFFPPPFRVPLSRIRPSHFPGYGNGAAPGPGTLARAGRRARRGRHRAVRGFIGGTPPGKSFRHDRRALYRDLQRPAGAPATHRRGGGSSWPASATGLATADLSAPHHRRAHAAGDRPVRHLVGTGGGRLHLPCRPPGRAQLRHIPGQCQRSRGRRHARFIASGHTPDARLAPPAPEINRDFPYTLDLRRQTK